MEKNIQKIIENEETSRENFETTKENSEFADNLAYNGDIEIKNIDNKEMRSSPLDRNERKSYQGINESKRESLKIRNEAWAPYWKIREKRALEVEDILKNLKVKRQAEAIELNKEYDKLLSDEKKAFNDVKEFEDEILKKGMY